jgi:hypothetical protein
MRGPYTSAEPEEAVIPLLVEAAQVQTGTAWVLAQDGQAADHCSNGWPMMTEN